MNTDKPTLDQVITYMTHRLDGMMMPGAVRMTTAARDYLVELQAENEKLRAGPRRLQIERDTLLAANQHLREEREQLTAERDDARATLGWFRRHGIRED